MYGRMDTRPGARPSPHSRPLADDGIGPMALPLAVPSSRQRAAGPLSLHSQCMQRIALGYACNNPDVIRPAGKPNAVAAAAMTSRCSGTL